MHVRIKRETERWRMVAVAVTLLTLCAALSKSVMERASDAKPAHGHAMNSRAAPFEIDMSHSTLNYRVRHLGVSYFFGRINMPEGTFLFDPSDPSGSHLNISVEIKNMDAGNEGRDKFLTGIDFFNAMEFPTAQFKSTQIKQLDQSTWEASGDFTLHGVTKPITVKLEEYAETQTSRFGYRAGFFVAFTIKRSDYGMSNFMDENMLGDEVMIFAGIEGARE